ncbi:type II secretion system protein [Uliginosibacterium sp. 31-16]|uniref:type II secretion system protein n=1 Tax=Uliginosibacterium sp. 31-16 TaxID=3068315 RepID=UPI00273D347A|nr:type II secretion system protein [Uliginosibacterium sp. 31-16]MDP5239624.1 type II secretion system protein [Uliginosibacterium sp. 31-16]
MPTRSAPFCRTGFSYVGLLIVIAIISLAATTTVQLGAIAHRRQAEEELLFIGLQYKRAIRSYFEAAPPGAPAAAPNQLEDLIRDPRFPGVRRHLRQLYPDPLTGKLDWVLIRAPDGKGLLGVHSRSKESPIRIDNFPDEFFHFKGKHRYSDWVFVYGVVCSDQGCEIDRSVNDPGKD